MKQEYFLSFNGKAIYFKENQNEYWIAIKPICEALNVDYIRAYKNLTKDELLSQLLSEQTMVGADDKKRKMVCLPEKFIYGWIFSLRSKSEELKQYRIKCYDILFNYFNGAIIGRKKILKNQSDTLLELNRIEKELQKNDNYLRMLELKQENKRLGRLLKTIDKKAIAEDPSLF